MLFIIREIRSVEVFRPDGERYRKGCVVSVIAEVSNSDAENDPPLAIYIQGEGDTRSEAVENLTSNMRLRNYRDEDIQTVITEIARCLGNESPKLEQEDARTGAPAPGLCTGPGRSVGC